MVRKKKNKKKNKAVDAEHHAERKPRIIWYDADGNEIGDDGYLMTPTRTRMHKLFNAMLIWGLIAFALGVFCTAFAYAQAQDYTWDNEAFEIIISGGTQLNGFDFAYLLRVEGLVCLFTSVFAISSNFVGFHWMYDNRSIKPIMTVLIVLIAGSVIYEGVVVGLVHLMEPVGLINIILCAWVIYTMIAVKAERPTLKKAKRVTKVVKEK